jgi:transcriptional repressor NrdR
MHRLRNLDKVAYVRFASVYLDFKDAHEFLSELQDLLRSKDVREARTALAAAERGKRTPKN